MKLRRDEAGFSLVELVVVISILGIISVVLTEAVILTMKTTEGTANRISNSITTGVLGSRFSRDVQSSDTVSLTDGSCAAGPVLLSLRWAESPPEVQTASYALDPPTGTEQDLIRWSCNQDGDPPTPQVLGHFTREASAPLPVAFTCDPSPCAGSPKSVTLAVTTAPGADPNEFTVFRRSVRG